MSIGSLLALGMLAWAVLATLVAAALCALIRRRNRQGPGA